MKKIIKTPQFPLSGDEKHLFPLKRGLGGSLPKKSRGLAFTFIELLVVISILAILMTWSIAYFGDFADTMTLKNELSRIKDTIDIENWKIANKEIFDYKIEFLQDKNYYLIYENVVLNDITIKFDSLNSWIWSFSFSWVSSWTWIIKYYKWYKFQKKKEIAYNESFTWDLSEKNNYKITWSFSWKTLNTIIFDYYNYKENQDIKYIWSNKEITNILWKKDYSDLEFEFENDKWLKDKILIN